MSISKAFLLAAVLGVSTQAWALPIGGEEPPDPPTHSGPIIPSPANLTVRARAESQVIIDFNCGGNVDTHEGWRRLGNKAFARVSYASGCSFKDSTVLPETNYCYRVRALNDTHEAWSPTLCVTTLAPNDRAEGADGVAGRALARCNHGRLPRQLDERELLSRLSAPGW